MPSPNEYRKRIWERVDASLARPTRIHRLPNIDGPPYFVKREDELSSGIAGSKLRKYASLIPALLRKGIADVGLIGGPNSNHLVGLCQLLKENEIRPWLFVRQAADSRCQGNALLIGMLTSTRQVIVVERATWHAVETIASDFLAQKEKSTGSATALVPEGGFCLDSLFGAMTLASDVLRNERELGDFFETLYVDCGTGLTAIGLILGLALFDPRVAERQIQLTLIAGTEKSFQKGSGILRTELSQNLMVGSWRLPTVEFRHPPRGRSFGSVTGGLLANTIEIARNQGLLLDPVYGTKHFLSMMQHRQESKRIGPALFINNGNPLGLMGFQERIAGLLALP